MKLSQLRFVIISKDPSVTEHVFGEHTRHARESLHDLDNPYECQWPLSRANESNQRDGTLDCL